MNEPRFIITVGADGSYQTRASANDVQAFEVARQLLAVATKLLETPLARIITLAELAEQQERQRVFEAHPAVRLVVRDGKQVYLGQEAVDTGILAQLLTDGWMDAGATPVKRPCDYAGGPEAFAGQYLGAVRTAPVAPVSRNAAARSRVAQKRLAEATPHPDGAWLGERADVTLPPFEEASTPAGELAARRVAHDEQKRVAGVERDKAIAERAPRPVRTTGRGR